MSNNICVIGTVGTDPRLTYSPAQVAFCTFRLASTDRRYDSASGQWANGETNWYSVQVFRSLAEHAKRSFAKGDRVIVSGRLRVRKWSTNDNHGTNVEVDADALGHDLRWGVSRFTPDTPPGADTRHGAEESPRPRTEQQERQERPEPTARDTVSDTGLQHSQAPDHWGANPTSAEHEHEFSGSIPASDSALDSSTVEIPTGDGFVPATA